MQSEFYGDFTNATLAPANGLPVPFSAVMVGTQLCEIWPGRTVQCGGNASEGDT